MKIIIPDTCCDKETQQNICSGSSSSWISDNEIFIYALPVNSFLIYKFVEFLKLQQINMKTSICIFSSIFRIPLKTYPDSYLADRIIHPNPELSNILFIGLKHLKMTPFSHKILQMSPKIRTKTLPEGLIDLRKAKFIPQMIFFLVMQSLFKLNIGKLWNHSASLIDFSRLNCKDIVCCASISGMLLHSKFY